MKHILVSVTALMLLAVPGFADDSLEGLTVAEPPTDGVMYAAGPTPGVAVENTYALPAVQLISTNQADVQQTIDGMRARLTNFDSLTINNGITQAANAYFDHWHLAAETSFALQSTSVQAMIGNLASQSTGLIEDFMLTPHVMTEDSLFSGTSFTVSVDVSPVGGFFAQ